MTTCRCDPTTRVQEFAYLVPPGWTETQLERGRGTCALRYLYPDGIVYTLQLCCDTQELQSIRGCPRRCLGPEAPVMSGRAG